jgi:hypothetical protein
VSTILSHRWPLGVPMCGISATGCFLQSQVHHTHTFSYSVVAKHKATTLQVINNRTTYQV